MSLVIPNLWLGSGDLGSQFSLIEHLRQLGSCRSICTFKELLME